MDVKGERQREGETAGRTRRHKEKGERLRSTFPPKLQQTYIQDYIMP
jgi:hypothetical protein